MKLQLLGLSSYFIIVDKKPLGYLLSLSCLSNHLQMRWQVTPAATVTIKVIIISLIVLTSSRCRVSVGQQNDYIIPQAQTEPFKIHIATQICPSLFSSLIPPHKNPQIFLSPSSFLHINITQIQRRQYYMKKTDKKQSKSRQEALNELTAGRMPRCVQVIPAGSL